MTRKRFSFILLIFLFILFALLIFYDFFYNKFFLEPKVRELRGENVILITVDGLNMDFYDDTFFPDEISRNRIFFENCITPSIQELPFYISLFSSEYPIHHHFFDNLSGKVKGVFPAMEKFKNNNYMTAAFISNIYLSKYTGLSQSFDFYFDTFDVERKKIKKMFLDAEYLTDNLLSWFKRKRKFPFFIWVNYSDLDNLILDKSKKDINTIRNIYQKKVLYIERNILRIINFLQDEQLIKDTVIIIASSRSFPLEKENIYPDLINPKSVKAPILFYMPKLEDINRVKIKVKVSSIDIMPTLIDLLLGEKLNNVDGVSFKRSLYGGKISKKRAIISLNYYPKYHLGADSEIYYSDRKTVFYKRFDGESFSIKGEKKFKVTEKLKKKEEEKILKLKRTKREKIENIVLDPAILKRFSDIGILPPLIFKNSRKFLISKAKNFFLSQRYFFNGFNEKAYRIIKDSDLFEAKYLKAIILLKRGYYQLAIGTLKELIDKFPYNNLFLSKVKFAYINSGEIEKGIVFFEQIVAKYPNNAAVLNQLGDLYFIKGDYKKAEEYFNLSVKISPLNYYSYFKIGVINIRKNNIESAKENLIKALESGNNIEDLYYYLGVIAKREGNLKLALRYFKGEVSLFPENYKVYKSLAEIYKKLSQYEKEIYYLKVIINYKPESVEPYFELAKAYLLLNRNLSETVPLVLKGIQNCKDVKKLPEAYMLLSEIYKFLGDSKKALYYKKLSIKIKKYGLSKSPVF